MTGRSHQQLERVTAGCQWHIHLRLAVHQVDVLRIHRDRAPGFRQWRVDKQMQVATCLHIHAPAVSCYRHPAGAGRHEDRDGA
jgi:hypothetical protein